MISKAYIYYLNTLDINGIYIRSKVMPIFSYPEKFEISFLS